jgi:predicted DCC family thiol-disulfide oxidoreductase YuxK
MDSRPIVFFDGVCNLCNKSVQFIIKRDKKKKFLFASLQGKHGQELLKKNDLPTDALNSFLLLEGERLYAHSTGALRVLKHLGGGWKILYGFIVLPKLLRDPIYNIIARNRYKWFGKKDQCMIPEPGLKERFLE